MKIIDTVDHQKLGKLNKYGHVNSPLYGIFNKPFVSFDSLELNSIDFNELNTEICICLAEMETISFPKVAGVIPEELGSGDFEDNVIFDQINHDSNLSKLKGQSLRKYLAFKHKSVVPWFNIVNLKPNKFATKHLDLHDWDPLIDKMPMLKKTILSLPFKEIGRVVIYQSWNNSEVPCHRDCPPKDADHHINFNPGGYRPVYVYDSLNKKKHMLPDSYRFYAYNTSDYHGVEPLPYISYTVRVDGIYDDHIIDKLKNESN